MFIERPSKKKRTEEEVPVGEPNETPQELRKRLKAVIDQLEKLP